MVDRVKWEDRYVMDVMGARVSAGRVGAVPGPDDGLGGFRW